MSTFRIITEEKHKYKKDSLYVLIFKDKETYGVDVANSTSNFGRVYTNDKENAMYLFSILNEFISTQDDYVNSCVYVSSLLSYDTFEEVILNLHTYRRKIEKLEAYSLIRMLGFEKQEMKMSGGTHFIKIFKKGEDEQFGEFISLPNTNKFMFHFS